MTDTKRNLPAEPLWTEDEVAGYLRIEVSTVRTWVKRRGLPVRKVGSLNRFRRADIDAWIERQTAESAAKKDVADDAAGKIVTGEAA